MLLSVLRGVAERPGRPESITCLKTSEECQSVLASDGVSSVCVMLWGRELSVLLGWQLSPVVLG